MAKKTSTVLEMMISLKLRKTLHLKQIVLKIPGMDDVQQCDKLLLMHITAA